jgi:hypothetical protein
MSSFVTFSKIFTAHPTTKQPRSQCPTQTVPFKRNSKLEIEIENQTKNKKLTKYSADI